MTRTDDPARWVLAVGRVGWVAKGIVYGLFGLLVVSIAVEGSPPTDADQRGALRLLAEGDAGRVLLVLIAIGLVLYAAYRGASVARPPGGAGTAERGGWALSAAWSVVLAWGAIDLLRGGGGGSRDTAEQTSGGLLETGWGTLVVALGGLVAVVIGVVFAARAARQDFMDDLDLDSLVSHTDERVAHAFRVGGVLGWMGRAVATIAVGVFAIIAAFDADITSAAGFDRTLRELGSNRPGGALAVFAIGGLLMIYGAFCATSAPLRSTS